jgi:hypothetical protein
LRVLNLAREEAECWAWQMQRMWTWLLHGAVISSVIGRAARHGCYYGTHMDTVISKIADGNCHGTEQYWIRSTRVRKLWQHTGPEALALVQSGPEQMGFEEEITLYSYGRQRYTYTATSRMLLRRRIVFKYHGIRIDEGHKPLASGRRCTIKRHCDITNGSRHHPMLLSAFTI